MKAIEVPFCPKENVLTSTKDWADELAASDKGSYYMQHQFKEVGPGNCVAVISENI